jgi:hypothetical protein
MNLQFDEDYARAQARRASHPVRRRIRAYYLRSLARIAGGPLCDYGCGTGSLLRYSPAGSFGFDINEHAIAYCQHQGLDAFVWDPEGDQYKLSFLADRPVRALVMNHVLEHLDDPSETLRKVLTACRFFGVERVVLVVPGIAGFRTDATHTIFIDAPFFRQDNLAGHSGFSINSLFYFPLPFSLAGRFFRYNELRVVFSRHDE